MPGLNNAREELVHVLCADRVEGVEGDDVGRHSSGLVDMLREQYFGPVVRFFVFNREFYVLSVLYISLIGR